MTGTPVIKISEPAIRRRAPRLAGDMRRAQIIEAACQFFCGPWLQRADARPCGLDRRHPGAALSLLRQQDRPDRGGVRRRCSAAMGRRRAERFEASLGQPMVERIVEVYEAILPRMTGTATRLLFRAGLDAMPGRSPATPRSAIPLRPRWSRRGGAEQALPPLAAADARGRAVLALVAPRRHARRSGCASICCTTPAHARRRRRDPAGRRNLRRRRARGAGPPACRRDRRSAATAAAARRTVASRRPDVASPYAKPDSFRRGRTLRSAHARLAISRASLSAGSAARDRGRARRPGGPCRPRPCAGSRSASSPLGRSSARAARRRRRGREAAACRGFRDQA